MMNASKKSGPAQGETLGQYRARHGLPGTDTGAAHAITWRDGMWRNMRTGEPTAPDRFPAPASEATGTGDLPAGWGWRAGQWYTGGWMFLWAPGVAGQDLQSATAHATGWWRAYQTPDAPSPFAQGDATARPGETLLTAARREAEAALWRVDGFGVGEVRGKPVPGVPRGAGVLRGGEVVFPLPGLPGLWSITAERTVDGGVEVDARRVDVRSGDEVLRLRSDAGDRCPACGADLLGIGCSSCRWVGEDIATHESEAEAPPALGMSTAEEAARDAEPLHPDPVIAEEVRRDMEEGRAIDRAAGIVEGWHKGKRPAPVASYATASPPGDPLLCHGCGDAIAEGSPRFERVSDGCSFCRGCAAENAAGDDPDEMRAVESEPLYSSDPEASIHVEVVRNPRAFALRGAGPAPVATGDAAELERLLPALPGAIRFAREAFRNDGAEGETVHLLARAAELLTRERERAHDILRPHHAPNRDGGDMLATLARVATERSALRDDRSTALRNVNAKNIELTDALGAAEEDRDAARARVAELEAVQRAHAKIHADALGREGAKLHEIDALRERVDELEAERDARTPANLAEALAQVDKLHQTHKRQGEDMREGATKRFSIGAASAYEESASLVRRSLSVSPARSVAELLALIAKERAAELSDAPKKEITKAERRGYVAGLDAVARMIRSTLAPSPMGAIVAEEPLFYIQDTRSFVGDSVLWWRPEGAGYTINLEEAGTYTAEQCRGNRETDKPIPVEVARNVGTTHVIAGRLREALACDAAKGGAE